MATKAPVTFDGNSIKFITDPEADAALKSIGLGRQSKESDGFVSQAGEVASFLGAPYVDRFDRFTLAKFGSDPFDATSNQSFGREPQPHHVALALALQQGQQPSKKNTAPPLYYHDDFAAIEAIARAIAARVSTEAPTWFYYNNVLIPIGYHTLTYHYHDETRSPQQTALALATEIWLKAKAEHIKKIGDVKSTIGHTFRLYQGTVLNATFVYQEHFTSVQTLSLKKWSFEIKNFGNTSLLENTQSAAPLKFDLYAVPISVLFQAYASETGVPTLNDSDDVRRPRPVLADDTLPKIVIKYSKGPTNAKPVSVKHRNPELIQATQDSIRQAFDRILAYARSTKDPNKTLSNMYIPIFVNTSAKDVKFKVNVNVIAPDLWKDSVLPMTIIQQLILSAMKTSEPGTSFVSVTNPLELSSRESNVKITFDSIVRGDDTNPIAAVEEGKMNKLVGFELNKLTPAQRDHLELLTPHIFVGKNQKDYDYKPPRTSTD